MNNMNLLEAVNLFLLILSRSNLVWVKFNRGNRQMLRMEVKVGFLEVFSNLNFEFKIQILFYLHNFKANSMLVLQSKSYKSERW